MMRILIITISLFFSVLSYSQSEWNLQQCIDYALKNNISLNQGELNTFINKNNLLQSKANILPSLNSAAMHTYNIGKNIDRYTNTFANSTVLSQNFYLSSQLTLWSGLAQYNSIKQNEFNYKSSIETLNQQKNDLALNIATAFLQVIYNAQFKEVSKNQVQISKLQLERTEKLVAAGTMAKSNTYDIKSQLASDQYNLTSAENNHKISLLTLQQLMNLDSAKNFSITQPNLEMILENISTMQLADIYNTALKTQASIKSAEYSWKGAEKGLLVAKGGRSPSINLSASIGTGFSGLSKEIVGTPTLTGAQLIGYTGTSFETVYAPIYSVQTRQTPFSDQFTNNVNKSIGFQLNIPIFNGLRVYTNIGNSKLNLYNQKLNYDLTKQQLFKNISQAFANAISALDKYNSAKLALEAAEISFGFTEKKFDAGALTALDFSNSKNRYVKSQADFLNSKFDYIFRMKVLDYYQGKPLTF